MPTGSSVAYVSGPGTENDHLDIPRHTGGYRQAHTVHEPKPAGLDWDSIAPTCKLCGQKSGTVNTRTGMCALCDPPAKKDPQQEAQSGQPTTRRSAPRAATAERNSRRARDLGASAHPEKNPATAQEMRPAAVAGPTSPPPTPAAAPASQAPLTPVAAAGTPDPEDHDDELGRELARATRLLAASADHASPAVQAMRGRVLGVLDALEAFLDATRDRYPTETSSQPETQPPAPAGRKKPRAARSPSAPRGKPVDEEAIVREYIDLDSTPVIAARHGIWPARVRRILDTHGVDRRDDRIFKSGGPPKPLDEYDAETVASVVDRYNAGETMAQIADSLHVSQRLISAILHKAGVPTRPAAHLARATVIDDDTAAEIAARYAAGESSVDLAREYRLRGHRCRQIITSRGVSLRNRGAASSMATAKLLDATGVDSHTVKVWAVEQGLIPAVVRGRVPGALVTAYAAAHPDTTASSTTQPSGDTA